MLHGSSLSGEHMHALVQGCEVHASDVIWVFGLVLWTSNQKKSLTGDTLFIWMDVNISRSKSQVQPIRYFHCQS
jgi:hypothetical protein